MAAVAVCIAVATGSGSLMLGVYEQVVVPLLPELPLDRFKVEARRVEVGILSFESLGPKLDSEGLDRMRGLPGVEAVHAVHSSVIPTRAAGGRQILGRTVSTDIFVSGVEATLVEDALEAAGRDQGDFVDHQEGPIPVVVSRRLLDLYNTTVAPAIGQPRLSASAVTGLRFELVLGASATQGSVGQVRREIAEVIGLSEYVSLAGVTVPLSTVERWDAQFGVQSLITEAWVEVSDPELAGRTAHAVEQAGFRVDETPKLIGWALVLASLLASTLIIFLASLAALVAGLAFSLMVSERRHEIAVLRALGAERARVLRWFLAQAALLGLVGAAVGCAAGWGLASLGNEVLRQSLSSLSFRPSEWVHFPPWIFVSGLALGTLAAVAGASIPAFRAAKTDPAESLRR
ncbi:MAG: ABC transporter permease [Myxococcota bacterium]